MTIMISKILGESATYYQSFLPSSFLFSQLPEAQAGTETSWLVGLKDQAQEFFFISVHKNDYVPRPANFRNDPIHVKCNDEELIHLTKNIMWGRDSNQQ
jgi:hypothetical protein